MDPLTHSLVGAALARTGSIRGKPLAMATLMLAANAPDIDVVAYARGGDTALWVRRGWSHGPVGMVLLPLLLTFLLVGWSRWQGRRGRGSPEVSVRDLLPLAYLGTLSHPALDWLNTYGVRFLMPVDDRWFYGDTLFIADPWIWLLLGGAVFLVRPRSAGGLVAWSALSVVLTALLIMVAESPAGVAVWTLGIATIVVFEIRGVGARSGWSARIVGVALALCLLYLGAMLIASRGARALALHEIASRYGEVVEASMVSPRPVTPFVKDVIVATDAGYRLAGFDWLAKPRLRFLPRVRQRPRSSPAVDAAWGARCVRGFAAWARFPVAEVDAAPEGTSVSFLDLRYARERTSGFGGAVVQLDEDLRPESCDE